MLLNMALHIHSLKLFLTTYHGSLIIQMY